MTKDWVHGVGHSPVCQILLQIVVTAVITSSPPAWTSSAGMLTTPAVFPFFSDCTAASTSLRRMVWSSSVSVLVQFSTDGSPLASWLYSSEQYSVYRFSICRSSVKHFPERSWTGYSLSPVSQWSNLRKNNSKRAYQLVKDLTTVYRGKQLLSKIVQEKVSQKSDRY